MVNMNVFLVSRWMYEASDDALRAVIAGGVPREAAVIAMAKRELEWRERS